MHEDPSVGRSYTNSDYKPATAKLVKYLLKTIMDFSLLENLKLFGFSFPAKLQCCSLIHVGLEVLSPETPVQGMRLVDCIVFFLP